MKLNIKSNEILYGDCRDILLSAKPNSIDLVITDPPYFLDGMDESWNNSKLQIRAAKAGVIGSRPIGMKFDRKQGYNFQNFLAEVSKSLFTVMKPGAFFVCFSQARLYHRAAVAIEDAGFEIRDMLAWHHNGQAKAFTQKHFINKNKSLSKNQKLKLLKEVGERKTPQLKPQLEPMVFAQKPKEGTFVDNWSKYKTGLIDTEQSLDGMFPGNLMSVAKPNKLEKGEYNSHLTVKPIALLEHLIRLLSIKNQIVLDPFLGSGSTAIAAYYSNRKYIGIEKDQENYNIAERRINEITAEELRA